ncbi:MAG TPA: T9SS type A sorting domain-containing protein [Saprospiraceae bacterium]|nr:T9SS type A sorting domain-containing protein [Saprospiraceae bacterium]
MKKSIIISIILLQLLHLKAQNFSFNFNTSGRRVCLVSSEVNLANNEVKIIFLDSLSNSSEPIFVNRRALGSTTWTNVANSLPAGTGHWVDTNVSQGQIWEYQVKRFNTWNYSGLNYDATGYTIGSLLIDNTNYKGQMILLVADDIPVSLTMKYTRLKKEITADGWFVNELIVPKASNWDSGNEVVTIKNQINAIYNAAPIADKPKLLFILGHVPLPRCGSTSVIAPDDHNENKGARGCDAYYGDINGAYTDTATYNPGGLATPLSINLPGDYKWDQDFFPSDIELAFGRVDFADVTDLQLSEIQMIENYLDRLSAYRNVMPNHDMGDKSAFYYGYDNSNDGSFRSLPNISKPHQVYQNYTGPNHNQWVQTNGSFKIYMQNLSVPEISDWQTFGMDATVYASDQSYWGFGDVPQPAGVYSRIRALLGVDTKCLITLWTTTGINIFHQACMGQSFGLAMKEIMNHNQSNQYLEKPQQEYDTQEWWNRTHFAFYGDPTINLYQIQPPSNVSLTEINGNVQLNWISSNDSNVMGYHVYESDSEFGIYNRVTTNLAIGNSYTLNSYKNGNWYIVKAVKVIESGCGKFLHSSIGESIQGNLVLSNIDLSELDNLVVYPNPSKDIFYVKSQTEITTYKIKTANGVEIKNEFSNKTNFPINISELPNGIYFIQFTMLNGVIYNKIIIKSN